MYRSSTGNLDVYDDAPTSNRGGGQRWDRDRFERMSGGRGGGGGRRSQDDFFFHEQDRGGRRELDIHAEFDRRGPPVKERDRYREDDRYYDRRSRYDLQEPTASEVANQALAPYRRKSVVERDYDIEIDTHRSRRPARPQYHRRQSSLDTYDRRPGPRYGDVYMERDVYRAPANVPIPLPIRERHHSPPRYRDEVYEEDRYVERERPSRQPERVEEYREVEVHRAKSRRRRSPSRSTVVQSVAASSSTSSFEEVKLARAEWGKKGKTRLPKRLCKVQAVIDLQYPYEEEEDFIVITRALEKDHIDEIISVSEKYKETKTTYVYEDQRSVVENDVVIASNHAPPPPPPPPPAPASVHNETIIYEKSVRGQSPPRHYEETFEESHHVRGPVTVFAPAEKRVVYRDRDTRSDREIKEEIRALEEERRMLKYERETEVDYEVVEKREPRREVIRIEKDRKVRREPNPKLVAAMMATLT